MARPKKFTPKAAKELDKLLRDFYLNHGEEDFRELKGTRSMDCPVQYLNLLHFLNEYGYGAKRI